MDSDIRSDAITYDTIIYYKIIYDAIVYWMAHSKKHLRNRHEQDKNKTQQVPSIFVSCERQESLQSIANFHVNAE